MLDDYPDAEKLIGIAVCAYEQGEIETAFRALQYVLDREPGNRKAKHYLKLTLESRARVEEKGPWIIYPTPSRWITAAR